MNTCRPVAVEHPSGRVVFFPEAPEGGRGGGREGGREGGTA